MIPPPPHETGHVPVVVVTSEPRLFGVVPPGPLLAVTIALFVLGILSLVTERWALGLVLLGLALLGLAGVVEATRRRPESTLGGRASHAFHRLSGWAGFAAAIVSARSQAARELSLRRRELAELGARRNELVLALGEAAYAGDEASVRELCDRLRALDEETARKQEEAAAALGRAQDRVREARLEVQPTEMVQVPEPYPPPDEGTPPVPEPIPEPMPPEIPEPYPPPDEGSPPSRPTPPEPGPSEPTPPEEARS